MRVKKEALEAERKAKEKEAADKAPAGKGKRNDVESITIIQIHSSEKDYKKKSELLKDYNNFN